MKSLRKYLQILFIAALSLILAYLPACKIASYNSGKAVSLMVSDSLDADSGMVALIEPYRLHIDSTMNIVIGVSSKALEKGTPESLLGDFCSDLILDEVLTRFKDSLAGLNVMVLLNNGGLRTSLPAGNITISDVYRHCSIKLPEWEACLLPE
jgi:2',3'-cyclic-nucleotide 2'-phosphodiesterase (5'-nucleotidase family)